MNTCWASRSQRAADEARPSIEPALLPSAEDRPIRRLPRGAPDHAGVAADLVVAVLPGVEQVHSGQVAPAPAGGRSGGAGRAGVRCGAAACARSRPGTPPRGAARTRLRSLRVETGPVGIHLVVVEDHRPGRDRVRALEVGIGLVLRVPPPVVGKSPHLAALVAAHVPPPECRPPDPRRGSRRGAAPGRAPPPRAGGTP